MWRQNLCFQRDSASNLFFFYISFFMNRHEQNNRNLSIAANEYKIVSTWLIDVVWMQITCLYIRLYMCVINADVDDFLIHFFEAFISTLIYENSFKFMIIYFFPPNKFLSIFPLYYFFVILLFWYPKVYLSHLHLSRFSMLIQ